MSETAPASGAVHIGTRGDLAQGKSRKFFLRVYGREVECFLVNFRGELRAFVNKCRHVAMTLDWVENRFFTPEGDFVLCPTHGALYEPGTGFCVFGPPAGKSLIRVPLEFRGEEVWAAVPADFEDVL